MNDTIDIVITWVDGNDEKWLEEKNKFDFNSNNDAKIIRYRDWDNLQYIFRGIEKYAPWVNKIFFVTYGHLPKWLNVKNEKIVIVNHEDFIPKEYLPVFNVNPIELNFHRIKGLSEKFIYFNDDTFIMKKLKPTDFFIDGKPCDSAIENPIVPSGNDIIDYILLNDMEIINKYFNKRQCLKKNLFKWINIKYGLYNIKTLSLLQWNKFVGMRYSHLPSSLLKSTYEKCWENEFDALDMTCRNKFRSKNDVNQYLFTNWQMVSNNFVPRKTSIGKFFLITDDNSKIIKSINKNKYKLICLNDNSEIHDFEKAKVEINNCLNEHFREKSSFEI